MLDRYLNQYKLVSKTGFHPDSLDDQFRSANDFCYPPTKEGEDAAILHAKALLNVD